MPSDVVYIHIIQCVFTQPARYLTNHRHKKLYKPYYNIEIIVSVGVYTVYSLTVFNFHYVKSKGYWVFIFEVVITLTSQKT